jgi:hypothetical protein
VWDTLVLLSGSDLPLRNVDDAALALAPYRGQNLIALHTGYPRNAKHKTLRDKNLWKDAMLGCDDFVFNVTSHMGMPDPDDLGVISGSQWAALSRDLVEDILNKKYADLFVSRNIVQ